MTTPADLAANAARVARRNARRAGILEGGTAVAPEPTPPEHVFRIQREAEIAVAAREAHQDAEAEDATVREEDAEATDTAAAEQAPADKPKRRSRAKASS